MRIVLFIQGAKKRTSKREDHDVWVCGLWFGLAFTRIFFYFSDYYMIGTYIGHTFYGNPNDVTAISEILIVCGYISWLMGMFLFFFAFEIIINYTRYVLTIVSLLFIIIIFILPFSLTRISIYFFIFIDFWILCSMLFWLTKKSTKELQTVSAFMLVGLILFGIGTALDGWLVREIFMIPPVFPIFLIIIGALIVFSPTFIKPNLFSRSMVNWSIVIVFNLSLILVGSYFYITYEFTLTYLIFIWMAGFTVGLITLYSFYQIFKILRTRKDIVRPNQEQEEEQDYLRIFTKPQKLTEDEITFHKEQKICLVCKNKISRLNYFCPSCGTLYCVKCTNALTNLENMCWVCSTAFDESKPSKPYQKEEEEKNNLEITEETSQIHEDSNKLPKKSENKEIHKKTQKQNFND